MLVLAEDGERMTDKLLSLTPNAEATSTEELERVLGGRAPTVSDLPYVERAVKESMRLYPPAWVVGREAIAK
ncbi:MAG: cytochrome P450 [Actinomycetota bacterium]|nr:cytochrome P450 [Actinomycetota bacterium]